MAAAQSDDVVVEKLMVEARLHLDEPMIRYKVTLGESGIGTHFVEGRSQEEAFIASFNYQRTDSGNFLDAIGHGRLTVSNYFGPIRYGKRFEQHEGDLPVDAVVLKVEELRSTLVKPCRAGGGGGG